MPALLLRRAVGLVVVLWVISVLTFALFFAAPAALGVDPAASYAGRGADAETLAAVSARLGLDQPLHVQYGRYLSGLVAGRTFDLGPESVRCPAPCLGYSFDSDRPVLEMILARLPVTASLAFLAAVLWLVLGVTSGVVAALRAGTFVDRVVTGLALAGRSVPVYLTGLIALGLLSYSWGVLPDVHYVPLTESPAAWLRNLLLPCTVLALLYAGIYARLTRSAMLETLQEDFVRTARAKGLRERQVVGGHALRAGLTPLLTVLGLDLGAVLGGAVLTEQTFGFPGIGKLAVEAVASKDLPVVLGVTLFATFFVVLANLLVDLLYAVVDPRVRLR